MSVFCLAAQPQKPKEKPIIVAVIDTGYGYSQSGYKPPTDFLCKKGHYDFVSDTDNYEDNLGHGTNVSGIINDYAGDADYCQIILKYYNIVGGGPEAIAAAINRAIELNVDIINISSGGATEDRDEEKAIKKALNRGITIVAAAGNSNINLDRENECYYPACYDDRIVVVGALDKNNKRAKFSNYGLLVKMWNIGVKVTSNEITLSGTSQATAVTTGKIVKEMWLKLKNHSY